MIRALKLRVVVEDSASLADLSLRAQHGLCIFLETDVGQEKMKILMDTGASPEVTMHNLDLLKISPEDLDLIVLSHGHYDHGGGLTGVLQRVGHKVPVIAHPQVFAPKLKISPFLKYIGLLFTQSEAEAAGAVLLPSQSPVLLAEGLITTGEVERRESLETVEGFWTVRDGCYCQDSIPDDQSLAAVIKGKGLVVISGCAHAGIINTIRQAQRLLGVEDLYAVVGGFHLRGANQERMQATAEILRRLDPKIIRPGHCTGQKAISLLQQMLGDRCCPLATGDLIEL